MIEDPDGSTALKEARDMLKNLRDWNAPAEHVDPVLREIERLSADHDFEVHPDNADAVEVFCQLGTQWRMLATLGGAVTQGLDYSAVDATLRLLRFKPARRTELFHDLRLMESAALKAMSEQRDAAASAAQAARLQATP